MAKGQSRSQYKQKRNLEQRETRPHAHVKHVRVPDKKARIVLSQIKGKDIKTARALLMYSPRGASDVILKVLNSAVANAENNLGLSEEDLFVEEVVANQGPHLKRLRPRAKGRADRILKRTSHISIYLNER